MRPRWLVPAAMLVLYGSLSFGLQQEEGQEEDAQDFQSEGDYRKGMQDIDHSFGGLLEERERFWLEPDTQRNAARLTDLFHRVETFWKGRGDEEAAGFARSGAGRGGAGPGSVADEGREGLRRRRRLDRGVLFRLSRRLLGEVSTAALAPDSAPQAGRVESTSPAGVVARTISTGTHIRFTSAE